MRVYKYECPERRPQTFTVEAPIIDVLCFDTDPQGALCFWATVDPHRPPVERTFRLAFTGAEIGEVSDYVGSCKTGEIVWHLFEVTPR